MPRHVVHGALSALTLVVASSAWAAPAPWVPNTTGNVGPAPTTFNKWEAIEAPAASGASCGNGSPYRFFINRTTTAANAKKTVIMFEGGGACSGGCGWRGTHRQRCRNAGRRSLGASEASPGTPGRPLRWQTSQEIRSRCEGSPVQELALVSGFPSSYSGATGAK